MDIHSKSMKCYWMSWHFITAASITSSIVDIAWDFYHFGKKRLYVSGFSFFWLVFFYMSFNDWKDTHRIFCSFCGNSKEIKLRIHPFGHLFYSWSYLLLSLLRRGNHFYKCWLLKLIACNSKYFCNRCLLYIASCLKE